MSNAKVIKSIIINNFKTFCKHCTIHGPYYFYKSTNWFVHSIWLIIIALSMGLCCFLSHMIWEKYVIDPTLTVVETTHYSVVKIEFPAVTICDSEAVFPPKTHNLTDLLLLRGYNQSEINQFYRSFTAVKLKGYEPETYMKKMHSLLEDVGYPLRTLLDMFKRPCNDLILECNWRSKPYNCSEMFRPVLTMVGHCCQFDIPYFRQHTKETNYISGMDSSEALDITVMRSNSTNMYPMLYVYDRTEKVTLIDSSISLTPESYFDVNIYTWVIDSSENVKALPLKVRKCIIESDMNNGANFYQECMMRLILKRVARYCRCLPFDYTAKDLGVDEYSACLWDRLSCVYQSIEKVQADIKEIIAESECYQRCDYVQYDTEVKFIKHQRHVVNPNPGASGVQVHFAEMTCMKYRREIIYTWDQMLANLGGIFGLCLGGSLISVIELIWFILELIFRICSAYFKKPVAPKESNKIILVSHKDMNSKKLSGKYNTDGNFKFVN